MKRVCEICNKIIDEKDTIIVTPSQYRECKGIGKPIQYCFREDNRVICEKCCIIGRKE